MSEEQARLIGNEVRYGTFEPMSDAEHQLWTEYHEGYSSPVAVDRAALTVFAPHLVPSNLSGRVKYVPIPRDDLWKLLTGKPRKKEPWNV